MACGTPVLTSNVSSLPEVAGRAALLVDPLDVESIASGIGHIMIDSDLRRMLIEKGYQQVHRFSWTEAAHQVLKVLESVVCQSAAC